MSPPDFSKLFEDGRVVESADFGRVTLKVHAAGELVLTTGRVAAFDPATSPETEAFAEALPPGRYPVVLSVAHFEDGDQRVAGAMLKVGEGAATKWEMALLPGQDVSELGEGEVFGYAVDSATGCFADEEAAARYLDAIEADEEFFDRVGDLLDETYVDTWSWASVEFDPATGLNMIVFSTGMGDGLYASYLGRDDSGAVMSLVTDFALFEHEELA
ncbi:MAG TPA: DUF4241 domain-containing protein [Pyrinomonadaceae bacterium]|nr:DUF4241 domain-containing protein [Pyrinomonadaceae bacterium]